MEQMPAINNTPDKDSEENKIDRRKFLKNMGKGALALWAANTIIGCKKDCPEFYNQAYSDLEKEFIKQGLSDTRVFDEFKIIYGKEAFEKFREKYNLSYEEAQSRWFRSISRRRETFLRRARNWKEVKRIADENGIDISKKLSYEIENGKVISINGKIIPEKPHNKNVDNDSMSEGEILESKDVDINVY